MYISYVKTLTYYDITISGHIADHWSDILGGLAISRLPNGNTMISGNVLDQTQLHSLLSKIRDMGVTLVELKQQKNEG